MLKLFRRAALLTLAAVALTVFGALGPGMASAEATHYVLDGIFSITPAQCTLSIGSSTQLEATGALGEVRWESSDSSIASVDSSGRVSAYKIGIAYITAQCESGSATAKIIVKAIAATSLSLRKTLTINPGATYQLVPSVKPAKATLSYASSDPTVVSVDERTGLITATQKQGVAYVTVRSYNGRSARCKVTVKPIGVSSVTLKKSQLTLGLNESYQLSATVKPASAYNGKITYRSSNPQVASVDEETGLVRALSVGKTRIYAESTDGSGKYASCTVTVKIIRATSVQLNKSYLTMDVNASEQLSATLKPSNVTDRALTWVSSNPAVVSVDENGLVNALSSGTAVVRVTGDGGRVSDTVSITVRSADIVGTVTISAAGDMTLGGDPRKKKNESTSSERRFQKIARALGDYSAFLRNLSPVFQNDDLTIVNLEGTLTRATNYPSSKTYVFRGQPAYAQILKKGGVELAAVDNNHSYDFYAQGASDTLKYLRQAGVTPVGRGITVVKKISRGGVTVKVGFCAFGQSVSLSTARSTISALDKKCDIVVASFHWGEEYRYRPTSAQTTMGRAAVRAGADLVVGHHSHLVSGIEVYQGKYIVYGLGTLLSCVKLPSDTDAIIFQQTFNVLSNGKIDDGGIRVIPAACTLSTTQNDAQPVLLTGERAERVKNKVRTYSSSFAQPADFS